MTSITFSRVSGGMFRGRRPWVRLLLPVDMLNFTRVVIRLITKQNVHPVPLQLKWQPNGSRMVSPSSAATFIRISAEIISVRLIVA